MGCFLPLRRAAWCLPYVQAMLAPSKTTIATPLDLAADEHRPETVATRRRRYRTCSQELLCVTSMAAVSKRVRRCRSFDRSLQRHVWPRWSFEKRHKLNLMNHKEDVHLRLLLQSDLWCWCDIECTSRPLHGLGRGKKMQCSWLPL